MKTHGIPVEVRLDLFVIGSSFFVPGVDRDTLAAQIKQELRQLGISVVTKRTIEGNILGVRVWRIP